MKYTEIIKAYCLICGKKTNFYSDCPVDYPCKRNSFYCQSCNAIARNRHVAKIILETLPTIPTSMSLVQFGKRTHINILHTCASGAIHNALRKCRTYIVSEYYDGVESGLYVNGVLSQNLEATSFHENTFDLIITEDILEHIADPEKACKEIKRILKPGGRHISTISVMWDQPKSLVRSRIQEGKLKHYLPPVYHGDPNRPEDALVFVDFGADVVDKYLSLTGSTEVLWSHNNRGDEELFAIYNNMVFVSRKLIG